MESMSEKRRRERAEKMLQRIEASAGSERAKIAAQELAAAEAAGPTFAVEKPDPTGLSASENIPPRRPPTPYIDNNSGWPYPGGLPSMRARAKNSSLPSIRASDDHLTAADIEALIAALGTRFNPDEAAIAERTLRELDGTVPNRQLIEEIGLAIAIHRRGRQ
jgi:hypothetical protein